MIAGGFILDIPLLTSSQLFYDAQEKPPWGMQDPPDELPDASMLQVNVDIFLDTVLLSQLGQSNGLSRSALDRNSLNTIPQSSQQYSNNDIKSFLVYVIIVYMSYLLLFTPFAVRVCMKSYNY